MPTLPPLDLPHLPLPPSHQGGFIGTAVVDFNQLVPRLCKDPGYCVPSTTASWGKLPVWGDPGIFNLKPHLTLRPYATGKAAEGVGGGVFKRIWGIL